MYHRFEENKYPSTNVRLKEFNLQLEIINQNKIEFISIDELRKNVKLLFENSDLRKKLSKNIREMAIDLYDMERAKMQWKKYLKV